MERKDKTERLTEDQNIKELKNDELAMVTGGLGPEDIIPLQEDPLLRMRKYPDNQAAGQNAPPPADDSFGEPGESPW